MTLRYAAHGSKNTPAANVGTGLIISLCLGLFSGTRKTETYAPRTSSHNKCYIFFCTCPERKAELLLGGTSRRYKSEKGRCPSERCVHEAKKNTRELRSLLPCRTSRRGHLFHYLLGRRAGTLLPRVAAETRRCRDPGLDYVTSSAPQHFVTGRFV